MNDSASVKEIIAYPCDPLNLQEIFPWACWWKTNAESGCGLRCMAEASVPVEFCSDRDGRVSTKLGGLGGGCGLGRGAGLLGFNGSAIFGVNESATTAQNRPPNKIFETLKLKTTF